MPLSEHEQRILEEIERRLAEEDPRLVQQVSRASVHHHVTRRIRLAVVALGAGFLMLMLFPLSIWIALAGFVTMLLAGLLVYQYLRRLSLDQLPALRSGGRLGGLLARLAERFRGPNSSQS